LAQVLPKFLELSKLRIWQKVTVLRTGVRWPPGRARVGKPPAGLGQGMLN